MIGPRVAAPRGRGRTAAGARALRRILGLTVAALALAASASAGDLPLHSPSRVEAAYLRNFARYVTWPEKAFPRQDSPWQIGVLGRDRFGDLLEQTLQGRTEQDRKFEVRRADSVDALRGCHIVFVGFGDPARRRAALAELKGRPVLTVGDADAFLAEGGVIQLVVGDTVQMRINLDTARLGTLRIQTKMLEVARAVVENGATRVLR